MEAIPKGHEKDYSHPAVQGVLYCNKLFEYERSYKEKGLSYAQVYKRRQKAGSMASIQKRGAAWIGQ